MTTKIFAEERHLKILNYLENKNVASVIELSEFLNVTQATIRRDLLTLDNQKKIIRTHGGALRIERNVKFIYPPVDQRLELESEVKIKMAKYVADNLISEYDSIMIDSGTSTLFCAKEIAKKYSNLTVVTNAEKIGYALSNKGQNRVIITGGEFIPHTQFQVGIFAEKVINSFRADKAIISATGLMPDQGIFTSNPLESQIKNLMIKNSKTTIILIDSTKFRKQAFCLIDDFSRIDYLITDNRANIDDIKYIENLGVKVIVV